MKPAHRALLQLCLLSIASSCSATPHTEEDTSRQVGISSDGMRVAEVVEEACRKYREAVCVEEGLWDAPKGCSPDLADALARKRRIDYAAALEGTTLEEFLDRIVELDPDYAWQRDAATGVMDLYPKRNAVLTWPVEKLKIRDATLKEILYEDDLLDLIGHDVLVEHGWGRSWLETRVSLDVEHATARQVLSLICAQVRPCIRWELLHSSTWGNHCQLWLRWCATARPPSGRATGPHTHAGPHRAQRLAQEREGGRAAAPSTHRDPGERRSATKIGRWASLAVDPSKPPTIRWRAIHLLQNVSQQVVPHLIDALGNTEDFEVRGLARVTATKMGPGAVPSLIELLESHGVGRTGKHGAAHASLLRENVVLVLGDITPPDSRALPVLRRLARADRESPVVRKYARRSINKIEAALAGDGTSQSE